MMVVIRRLTLMLILLLGVAGLTPLLPLTFGFYTADVTNDNAGTYYPATDGTPFLSCLQDPALLTIERNIEYTGKYFRCTNNWGTDVTFTWSVARTNGTGLTATGSATVPAGAQGVCTQVTLMADTNRKNRTVVYKAAADHSDLYAEIQFPGTVTIENGATPSECV